MSVYVRYRSGSEQSVIGVEPCMRTGSGLGVDALLPQPRPDLHERAPEQIQALVDLPVPEHRVLVEEHEIRRARRQ